jgi:spore germination protein GerM
MGDPPSNRPGGFGNAISLTDVDFKTEDYHNVHSNNISANLKNKLSVGQWYHVIYTCVNADDNKSVLFKCDIDGKTVLTGANRKPPAALMNKAAFDKESLVWLRMNNEAYGEIAFRNVKVIAA